MKSFKGFIGEQKVGGLYGFGGAKTIDLAIKTANEKNRFMFEVYYILAHAGQVSGSSIKRNHNLKVVSPPLKRTNVSISEDVERNIYAAMEDYLSDQFTWVVSYSQTETINYTTSRGTQTQARVAALMILHNGTLVNIVKDVPGVDKLLSQTGLKGGGMRGRGMKEVDFGRIVFTERARFVYNFVSDGTPEGNSAATRWENEMESTAFWGRIITRLGLLGVAAKKFFDFLRK